MEPPRRPSYLALIDLYFSGDLECYISRVLCEILFNNSEAKFCLAPLFFIYLFILFKPASFQEKGFIVSCESVCPYVVYVVVALKILVEK